MSDPDYILESSRILGRLRDDVAAAFKVAGLDAWVSVLSALPIADSRDGHENRVEARAIARVFDGAIGAAILASRSASKGEGGTCNDITAIGLAERCAFHAAALAVTLGHVMDPKPSDVDGWHIRAATVRSFWNASELAANAERLSNRARKAERSSAALSASADDLKQSLAAISRVDGDELTDAVRAEIDTLHRSIAARSEVQANSARILRMEAEGASKAADDAAADLPRR